MARADDARDDHDEHDEPALDNIVLTGFMGTGKTTVGRIVAAASGRTLVDTDAIIEARYGPIPDIFASGGESIFRSYEREVATTLADGHSRVISTGGKLMLDADNARRLGGSGRVFCLVASVDTIVARLVADDLRHERPLLAGPGMVDRITTLMRERAEGYARFESVTTDDRSPDDVAADILGRLGEA